MKLAAALGLLLAASAAAQDDDLQPVHYPTLRKSVRHASDFVPSGWKTVAIKTGDLNGDHRPDVAVLMRMTDQTNIRPVDTKMFSYKQDDTNPYLLAIGFAGRSGYTLAASNHDLFPRLTAPMHEDTPPDNQTIKINGGALTLGFEHLRSHEQYRFRWDGRTFRLIGYDSGGSDGHCVTVMSINLLTHRAIVEVEGLSEEGTDRKVSLQAKRGSRPTMTEVSAEGFYPESLLRLPLPQC